MMKIALENRWLAGLALVLATNVVVIAGAAQASSGQDAGTLKGVLHTHATIPLLSMSTEGRYPVASLRVDHEGRPVQLGFFDSTMGTCSISFANYSRRFSNGVSYSIPAGTTFASSTLLRTRRSRALMTGPYVEFVVISESRLANSDKVTAVVECRRTVEESDPAQGYTVDEVRAVLAPHAITIE